MTLSDAGNPRGGCTYEANTNSHVHDRPVDCSKLGVAFASSSEHRLSVNEMLDLA